VTRWELYFMTIVGWQFHPGYLKNPEMRLSVEESASIADKMVRLTEERKKWDGE